jgi:hypothetical protein
MTGQTDSRRNESDPQQYSEPVLRSFGRLQELTFKSAEKHDAEKHGQEEKGSDKNFSEHH